RRTRRGRISQNESSEGISSMLSPARDSLRINRIDFIEAWRDRLCQVGKALELLLRFGLSHETLEMRLGFPLGIVRDPTAVKAAMDADGHEAGLMSDHTFGRFRKGLHQFGLSLRLDLIDIDERQACRPGIDCCG